MSAYLYDCDYEGDSHFAVGYNIRVSAWGVNSIIIYARRTYRLFSIVVQSSLSQKKQRNQQSLSGVQNVT
jgi:hypothetical protein